MPLFRLDLEYHGARYRGWQVQQNAQGVANLVQDACRKVFGGLDELQAAGRTDSGVHALQQVAHLRAPWTERRPPDKRKINDLLPADIAVRSISPAPSDFHARHSAVKRVYLYQVMRRRSAFAHDITWWVKDQLDVGIIRQAAGHFCGLHDFRSFCQQDAGKKENTRILLESLDIKEEGPLLLLRFTAPYFLWKMVRRITGFLAEAGRGRFSPDQVPAFLEKYEPSLAAHTAPPSGLFLERVLYPGETNLAPVTGVLHLPSH